MLQCFPLAPVVPAAMATRTALCADVTGGNSRTAVNFWPPSSTNDQAEQRQRIHALAVPSLSRHCAGQDVGSHNQHVHAPAARVGPARSRGCKCSVTQPARSRACCAAGGGHRGVHECPVTQPARSRTGCAFSQASRFAGSRRVTQPARSRTGCATANATACA